ncbi:hypothetical protein [Streptomyces sp. NRRL F-5123]|uniref:hypothetical protein n=1 Tax=Streptomyces sp. NRRL F-5123 TaxID=1463856 RepID=UPI0004E1FAA1|nr:hypothetical protein [Streptomyces sp. NRRL F-5123]
MGDHFQRIVDVEVGGEEAGPLAERMVDWMTAEGLLTRERSSDGVYSPTVDEGYVPGQAWGQAVDDAWGQDWIPGPVAVVVGRDHHVGGQGTDEAEYADCPRCGTRTVVIDYPEQFEADPEVWERFENGIAAWKATGEGDAPCTACGALVPVTEWQWESGFALGALAFDFWGWPPLSPDFLQSFARRLGHRTAEHSGKF